MATDAHSQLSVESRGYGISLELAPEDGFELDGNLDLIKAALRQMNLVLCFVGATQCSDAIISDQTERYTRSEPDALVGWRQQKQLALAMKAALLRGKLDEFGWLLGQAGDARKKMSPKMTTPVIDEMYDAAVRNGASGGKVTGATLSAAREHPLGCGELDAVFLDRDGTINVKAPEGCYITSPRQLRLLAGAGRAVRRLNEVGLLVLVATNQRGVALGKMTLEDVGSVNQALQDRLGRSRARVDGFYMCPHNAGSCDCRKPAPGLLLQAGREHGGLRLSHCVMVGDGESDVQAGHAAGCRTIRLAPYGTATEADALYPDLATAVDALIGSAAARARAKGHKLS